MRVGDKEFDLIRKEIYGLCGLRIPDGKQYLIEHRFSSLFKNHECRSWMDFYELLCSGDISFKDEVISCISTHETSFFRDTHPFNSIRMKVLPKLVCERRMSTKIRVWCTAASTGQEPYSLAMLIHDFCKSSSARISPSDFSILATDISGKVLDRASEGIFSKLEISRGLPAGYIKYFAKQQRNWKLNDDVRSIVTFKKLNLLNSFSSLGKFDFVMCRNVLIYFDDQTKVDIVHRIHSLLPNSGYLMLGSTETLSGHTDWFTPEHLGPVILYRKDKRDNSRTSSSSKGLGIKKAFPV